MIYLIFLLAIGLLGRDGAYGKLHPILNLWGKDLED